MPLLRQIQRISLLKKERDGNTERGREREREGKTQYSTIKFTIKKPVFKIQMVYSSNSVTTWLATPKGGGNI